MATMLLKKLSDWSKSLGTLQTGILKSAKASQLGHFAVLEIELEGSTNLKLLEVGSDRINRVLPVLQANIGRSLAEIGEMTIDD